MSEIPSHLFYSKTHEWVRQETDDTYTIGVTDYAQCQLGDLVFVDLPEINREIESGEEIVVLESVKTAADVYSPLGGEIIAINQSLKDHPDHVNKDPYGEGWLYRIKQEGNNNFDHLLDAKGYAAEIGE